MAERTPPFRPAFPLLLTSTLLLAQPMTAFASGQVQCRAGTDGGWACTSIESSSVLPPRPQRISRPVSAGLPDEVQREAQRTATPVAAPDFSALDWVPRDQLSAEQQAGIAAYCSGAYVEPEREGRDDQTPFAELPIQARADSSSFDQESRTGRLEGDVDLRQGRLQALADSASFDQNQAEVQLTGNVRLRDQGVLVLGERARMQIDSGETRIDDVRYVVHEARARGEADKLMRRDDAVIVLTNSSYTTCEPGENTWALHSKDIELDREKGWGEAKHVTLRVKDVPVFYTPYLYFPLDDRRQSGLLPPSFGTSSDNGTEVLLPYYLNLAPNYDATLYPRLLSKRGLQMEGELRYLRPGSEGQVTASFLDDSEFGDNRWLYGLRHDTDLSSRWTGSVDFTDISDPFYFQDLDSTLQARSGTYVNQRGAITYRGDNWRFQAVLHSYELATITSITPYERLPQLRLDGSQWLANSGVRFDYRVEYSHFDRNLSRGFITGKDGVQLDADGNPIARPDENLIGLQRASGHRLAVSPQLSYPLRNSWGFVTPALRLQSTRYALDFDNRQNVDPALWFDYAAADTSPSSNIPVASLDAGLYFDRDTSWLGRPLRQTLEPRAFYLYTPYRNQDDQPLFDTTENTFSYASLFRDDRFSGNDRTADANQLALGVTTRGLESNGVERARASLGQIFYFADQRVQLLQADGLAGQRSQQSSSAWASEFMYRVSDAWRLRGDLLWDPDENDNNAGGLVVNYQPEDRKVLNAGYRFRNNVNTFDVLTGSFRRENDRRIDQSDLSFAWPLTPQWGLIGRWQHDFASDRTLEAFGGLEYDSCCWKLRLVNRYWVDYNEFESVTRDEGKRGIFLQVVLKGLGSVAGNRVESLLSEGIPGYNERD